MPSVIRGSDNFDSLAALRSGGAYSSPTRALNTPYTNTSSRFRWVQGYCTNGSAGVIEIQVDGIPVLRLTAASAAPEMPFHALVPPGSVYRLNNGGTVTITQWREIDL